jgi:hypothetical protein
MTSMSTVSGSQRVLLDAEARRVHPTQANTPLLVRCRRIDDAFHGAVVRATRMPRAMSTGPVLDPERRQGRILHT